MTPTDDDEGPIERMLAQAKQRLEEPLECGAGLTQDEKLILRLSVALEMTDTLNDCLEFANERLEQAVKAASELVGEVLYPPGTQVLEFKNKAN